MGPYPASPDWPFSSLKSALAKLAPIRAEILRLNADPAHVDKAPADAPERARAIAGLITAQVKDVPD